MRQASKEKKDRIVSGRTGIIFERVMSMPKTTASKRRVNYYGRPAAGYAGFEDGVAVRNLGDIAVDIPRKKRASEKSTDASAAKGAVLSRWFVIFLAVCCAFTTIMCIAYLQERSKLISLNDEIGILESTYTGIKGDNDAQYNRIISSFTLEDVKEAAQSRLGMHYAEADQVRYYSLARDSYVRQYQEVAQP